MTVRILIAEDHSLVRRGLRDLIEGEPGFTIVGEAVNGAETLRLVEELRPTIVLLDISLPDMTGIEIARRLRATQPAVAILILTVHEDQSLLREAFGAGVMGYIIKRAADDELIRALLTVARAVQERPDFSSERRSTCTVFQTTAPRGKSRNNTGDAAGWKRSRGSIRPSHTPRAPNACSNTAHHSRAGQAREINPATAGGLRIGRWFFI